MPRSTAGRRHVTRAAIDEKALGRGHVGSARASSGSPQREAALPTETVSRVRVTARRKVDHTFVSGGLDRSVAAPGTGLVGG